MMKTALSLVVGLGILLIGLVSLQADDKVSDPVTLKGTVTCAKCDLKETDKCHTVVKVTEKGKDVVYYFDQAGSKKYHKPICTEAKKGEVTGVVSKKDGKNIITVSEVKFEDK
jgi:hypothetical protein